MLSPDVAMQVLAHADINNSGRQKSGVAPGSWLRLTSTQSSVSATLSHSTMTALLLAAQEWSVALAGGGSGGGGGGGEGGESGACEEVEVENTLGVDVEVAVDSMGALGLVSGGRTQVQV